MNKGFIDSIGDAAVTLVCVAVAVWMLVVGCRGWMDGHPGAGWWGYFSMDRPPVECLVDGLRVAVWCPREVGHE